MHIYEWNTDASSVGKITQQLKYRYFHNYKLHIVILEVNWITENYYIYIGGGVKNKFKTNNSLIKIILFIMFMI